MSITRILIPTDFSEAATRALEYGSRLAATLGAELTVLHVVNPPAEHGWMEGADHGGATTEAWLADADTSLLDAVEFARGRVPFVRGVMAVGREAEEILDFTNSHGINLIVMGMHGHGRTARWLHGSVTDLVLRRAPCPVLAIPACARDGHVPEADRHFALLDALADSARLAS